MEEHTDTIPEGAEWRKNNGYKKKNKYENHSKTNNYTVDNIFRGVGLKLLKEGPELYAKTIEGLGLYASRQFKNGSDMKKCLMSGKVVKPKVPDLAKNHTVHEKGYGSIK